MVMAPDCVLKTMIVASLGRRGHLRKQPPGKVLPTDGEGASATCVRDRQVGQAGGGDCADSPADGGGAAMMRRNGMILDLDQEIRDHIEMATQERINRGMSPEEACHG